MHGCNDNTEHAAEGCVSQKLAGQKAWLVDRARELGTLATGLALAREDSPRAVRALQIRMRELAADLRDLGLSTEVQAMAGALAGTLDRSLAAMDRAAVDIRMLDRSVRALLLAVEAEA